MSKGMIHRLLGVFMDAAKGLGVDCDCAEVERLAVMIHRAMSYQSRQFHTLEHVFGFINDADDARDHIRALAAAFHDLVYYQVDDGLPPDLAPILCPYLAVKDGTIRLVPRPGKGDRSYDDCLAIFGFEASQDIKPFGGLNEFLSALAMAKVLDSRLPRSVIASIAACIEATIPFRGPAPAGQGIGEALEARLSRLAREEGLDLGPEGIREAVRRAILFANDDVRDFSASDVGFFLSNTWKLLPESNAPLRRGGTFSVREYRVALQKMLGFFRSLRPEWIYHSYDGVPDRAAMEALAKASRRNLDSAQAYLQAKLLAVGLIEAAAEVSGGDAPMALFMGDLPQGGAEIETLTSFLTPLPAPAWISTDNAVYKLLKDGRLDESSFDLKNSPFALHLYHRLSPNAWGERARAAEELFAGRLAPEAFLSGFPGDFLSEFMSACASMVPTRASRLASWRASS